MILEKINKPNDIKDIDKEDTENKEDLDSEQA